MRYLTILLIALFAFQVFHCQEVEVEVPEETGVEVDVPQEDAGEEESESAVGSALFAWEPEEWFEDDERAKISDFAVQWVIADQIGNHYIENLPWTSTLTDIEGEEDGEYTNYTFWATMSNSAGDNFQARVILSISPTNGMNYWVASYSTYLPNQANAPADDALLRVSWVKDDLTYGEDFVFPENLNLVDPEGESRTNNWSKLPQADWLNDKPLQVEGDAAGKEAIQSFIDQGLIDGDLTWSISYVYPYDWVQDGMTYYRFDLGIEDADETLSGWGAVYVNKDADGNYQYVTAGLIYILDLNVLYPNN